jgi:hypothetical protein
MAPFIRAHLHRTAFGAVQVFVILFVDGDRRFLKKRTTPETIEPALKAVEEL